MCEGSKYGQCTSISTFDFVVEVIRPIVRTSYRKSCRVPKNHCRVITGDIIDDADHKRVLGLFLWYGRILLLLELIAPSRATHARTCCEELCGCSAMEMACEIPEIFYAFGQELHAFMFIGILLEHICRKLFQFAWEVRNVPICFTDQVVSAASFTRATHYSTLSFTFAEDSQFFNVTANNYLDIFVYSSISGVKCSLLWPHACVDLARVYRNRKVKKQTTASLSFAWIVSNVWCFDKAK